MTPAELRQKDSGELVAMTDDLHSELFRLRMQHHTGQLDKVSRLKDTSRDIARIKTILRERELASE